MSEALGEDGGENEFAKDRKHDEGMRGGVSEGRRGGELGSGSSREPGRLQRSRILRAGSTRSREWAARLSGDALPSLCDKVARFLPALQLEPLVSLSSQR